MRVGAKYISKSDVKDYCIITRVEGNACWYKFFTPSHVSVGLPSKVAVATILEWGRLVNNNKIKY